MIPLEDVFGSAAPIANSRIQGDGPEGRLPLTAEMLRRTTTAGASGASLRDFHNSLVTSPRIDGEWSDPVCLNSSGFDPSLFHDDDGRKYLVNMLWDHRPGQNRFAGIVLQEYSPAERTLVGERHNILTGTAIGLTEAPHLYRRDGLYYLLTAEGGTGWGHAVTMARSRTLLGPYELHPDPYILSARHRPDAALQRAGHADLVETPSGDTYMVYLCGRPLANRGALHTRTRDRHPADDVGRGRLAAHQRRSRRSARPGAGACRSVATAASRRVSSRKCRWSDTVDRLSVAAIAGTRRSVQPARAHRSSPAVRSRKHRQPVHAGARRAAPAGTLLQRRDARRVRSAALPADGWPGLLLQQHQVSLPVPLARRRRHTPSRDVSDPRLGHDGRVHAANRDRTRASSRTRRPRPGCRTSPARSWGWRARTSRVPGSRRTSTGSSIASAPTSSTYHNWSLYEDCPNEIRACTQ